MGITSAVVQSLVNLATSASLALPNTDPTPSTLRLDPGEEARNIARMKLLDLTIPDSLRDWLTPPLTSLGFSIAPKEVQDIFGSPKRSYNVIQNAVGHNSLFHIPKEILQDGSNCEAVGGLIYVLRLKKQVLIVVSEGLPNTHVAYSLAERVWLEESEVRWIFVPWGHLEEIKPLPEDKQTVALPNLLRLEDLLKKAQGRALVTGPEIATLVNILSLLPRFSDTGDRAWRLLMDQAGLKGLTGSFSLGGAPNVVAYSLISQLNDYAPLPDYPQDQVLGRLLCQVLKIPDLKPDDANKIEHVVKTHHLAPSFIDL